MRRKRNIAWRCVSTRISSWRWSISRISTGPRQGRRGAELLPPAHELMPDNARYVYAFALNSNGAAGDALALLEETHRQHPADRNVLMALVSIGRDNGNFCRGTQPRPRAARPRPGQHAIAGSGRGARIEGAPVVITLGLGLVFASSGTTLASSRKLKAGGSGAGVARV